ncbi:MAG: hypothetical protein ACJ8CB_08020 [Ktedonobacteraceae bacterium]
MAHDPTVERSVMPAEVHPFRISFLRQLEVENSSRSALPLVVATLTPPQAVNRKDTNRLSGHSTFLHI